MAKEILHSNIPYPDFKFMEIIQSEEFDENNHELQNKLNETINQVNINSLDVENLKANKAEKTDVANSVSNLQGQITANKTAMELKDTNLQNQITTNKTASEAKDTDLQNQVNNLNNIKANKADVYTKTELSNGQLDNRYYTKSDLTPFLRGGDTLIREEVYTIVNSNNGDGTFTYSSNGNQYVDSLSPEGYQIFTLRDGVYGLGLNRVEIIINDTLRRSVKSGGVMEIDDTHVALTQPEGIGAEITIRYYERIGMSAEYNLKMGNVVPPKNEGKNMWIDTRV